MWALANYSTTWTCCILPAITKLIINCAFPLIYWHHVLWCAYVATHKHSFANLEVLHEQGLSLENYYRSQLYLGWDITWPCTYIGFMVIGDDMDIVTQWNWATKWHHIQPSSLMKVGHKFVVHKSSMRRIKSMIFLHFKKGWKSQTINSCVTKEMESVIDQHFYGPTN